MPFRYHCTNPDTGKYEYLWVDEVSHIMIHSDDASRESMRDAAQNFSIEIMHFQLMATSPTASTTATGSSATRRSTRASSTT